MLKKIVKLYLSFLWSTVAWLCVQRYLLEYKLIKSNFKTISIKLSMYNGSLGFFIRRIFYRRTLSYCGENLNVHFGAYIVYPSVKIGDNCCIEEYSVVSNCEIGDDVIIAANVSIMSGAHHHEIDNIHVNFNKSNGELKKINIGNNVWIGTRAIIMNDVSSDCIIGAGSVVTNIIPQYAIAVGIPARVTRYRGRK